MKLSPIRRFLAVSLLLTFRLSGAEMPPEERIVFLGDSISQAGTWIEMVDAAMIAAAPGTKHEVIPLGLSSETVSGLSEDGHAGGAFPRPDLHERLGRVLEKARPQLIVACYGMNDGIYWPPGEERARAFKDGMQRLRDKAAAAGARVIHLTPPVFDAEPNKASLLPAGLDAYPRPYVGYDEVLKGYSEWLLGNRAEGWVTIDVHGPMTAALAERRKSDPGYTFARDGVHPNREGHVVIASALAGAWGLHLKADGSPDHPHGEEILAAVHRKHEVLRYAWLSEVGHLRPGVQPGLPLAEAQEKAAVFDREARRLAAPEVVEFPGTAGEWHGYPSHEFAVAGGKMVTVVSPREAAPGRPWVWHGEFFGHKPAPDIALLGKGFHLVYLKIPDMLGSPGAVALWDQCYAEMSGRYGLSKKPALVGLSRGGLYCYNWAIANPDKVSCIYADAAVCDFRSWPGGKGKGKGDPGNWALVQKLWNFPDEAAALAYTGNPVDNLAPLAAHHVPLLHVYGDADDVVPWPENTGLVAERYRALGGQITLIAKPGVGHHPHGLEDSTPIVEFIEKAAR